MKRFIGFKIAGISVLTSFVISCGQKVDDDTFKKAQSEDVEVKATTATIFDGERHFSDLKQLTFGGQNAEAYFSRDGQKISFQSTRHALECDAIFTMNADGSDQIRLTDNPKDDFTPAWSPAR